MTDEREAFIERQLDFDVGIIYNENERVVHPHEFEGVHKRLVDTPEKREAFRRKAREADTGKQ